MRRLGTCRLGRWGVIPFVLLLSCVAACDSGKSTPPAPPSAATVNGEAILLAEFERRLAEEMALAKGEAPLKAEETESLEKAVLEDLIREKLMLQRARDLHLLVSEEELAARVEEIRKDYNDQFDKQFGNSGVDFVEWREALRRRMLIEKLIERDVNAKVQVADREAEQYFNANRKAYATERRVRVAQIVVPDRKRAEGILKRLKAGEDFGMVARETSIGPEAAKGGDLGFFERGVMPEAIDRVVFTLPPGKISGVVKSPYGFHIIKVLAQVEAGGRIFAEVKEKVRDDLRKRRQAEFYRTWIETLRAGATVRIDRPLAAGAASGGRVDRDARQAVPERN